MKEQDIIKLISERHGISKLNDMQVEMSGVNDELTMLVAPTGSGKTIAFSIAALKAMGSPDGNIQTVIIAPSRELVLQIYDVIRPIAQGYKTVAFYGGHKMEDETKSLSVTPDIIVATPGRLVDHIKRGQIPKGAKLSALVLDEYDKSLELGFADEMRRIIKFFPTPKQIILTSATKLEELPDYFPKKKPRVLDYSDSGMRGSDPRSRMRVVHIESLSRDKLDSLIDLIYAIAANNATGKSIIFVNHRESAERVHNHLKKLKLPAGLYHGGLEQIEREKAIELLNNGTTPILVSTDLAARGLDIDEVDSVIHYHMPPSQQAWVHRNGRTARQDASGTVYVITSEGENIPEYVEWDNDYYPPERDLHHPPVSEKASLYFAAGKKEKISRGDIVGFLIAEGGLTADEIGRIALKDHYAIVAIPRDKSAAVLAAVKDRKIKNKKVKISRV